MSTTGIIISQKERQQIIHEDVKKVVDFYCRNFHNKHQFNNIPLRIIYTISFVLFLNLFILFIR